MNTPRAWLGLATIFCALGCTRANPDQAGISKDGTLRVVSAVSSHSLGSNGSLGAGAMFVQVDLVLGNRGVLSIPLQAQRFAVETSGGMDYAGAFFSGAAGTCIEGENLPGGGAIECVVVFEVPAPAAMRTLFYLMPDQTTLSVPLSAQCIDCTTTPSMQPTTNEKCGSAAACGSGSYEQCTVTGPPCSARFLTSDGRSFSCSSCTDCQAAAAQVASWCNGTTPTPSGDAACAAMASASSCDSCCQTNHSTGASRWLSLVTSCECTNPGDCSFECASTLCAGTTTVDATCSSCLQNTLVSGGDCDETNACNTDVNCAAYLACINACPAV
jgi:hypothetical protein